MRRIGGLRVGKNMTKTSMEQKALGFLNAFEQAGKTVGRVSIEGRRIEIDLVRANDSDEFDRIDMRHDKT